MRPLVQRENIKTQRKASLQRGQGERTHRSAGKEPSERLEGNQGRLAWQVGDRRVFQEGRSGKPCRELRRRQRARAPPHVATGSSGVNAAEAPSATPGRRSQVGRAEEGAAVRRKRGGAATIRGLTRQCGSVLRSPCAFGTAEETSGMHDPKRSAAAWGGCQVLLQIAGPRAV